MICRMWHGITPRSKADAYTNFLAQRAIPDYRSIAGNLSAAVLRRDEGEVTHFMTVTHWETEGHIRAFAGNDLLKAKYYPEDRDFLVGFEPEVRHFVVLATDSENHVDPGSHAPWPTMPGSPGPAGKVRAQAGTLTG